MKCIRTTQSALVRVFLIVTTMMLAATSAAYADGTVPYAFSPGQTISSAQVNANFEALSARIAALEAQSAPVSIVGTYDYFSLGFGMEDRQNSGGGKPPYDHRIKHKYYQGTLVFTESTVTVNGTGGTDKMIFENWSTESGGFLSAGVFSTESDPEIGTVAYTLSGSTVTFAASAIDDSGFVGTLSADRKILIGLWKNTTKGNKGTIVAMKRAE
jgi:hypothetical protein